MSKLIHKLSTKLFSSDADQTSFESCLTNPPDYSPALVMLEDVVDFPFAVESARSEQPPWVKRLAAGTQAGRHPLHDSGAYYCLDYSSVIAALPIVSLPQNPDLVVDVCASPGGKSILAWRALRPKKLVANEVIGKRCAALISNFKRCRISPAKITSAEADCLANEIGATADLVLVDAPCSGQSLLAKGETAQGAFHPALVNGNSNRQKRILAQSGQMVKLGGHMLYSTCTYSKEENEDVVKWFLKKFSDFEAVETSELKEFRSTYLKDPCYRLFPMSGIGAGSFSCLFKRINIENLNADSSIENQKSPIRIVFESGF